MRNLLHTTLLAAILLTVTGGCAYVNVRTPYDTDLDNTQLGNKVGMASNQSALWLFAWGDGSYAKAAENGDIKVMRHADQQTVQYFLGLYTKVTTIVYGD